MDTTEQRSYRDQKKRGLILFDDYISKEWLPSPLKSPYVCFLRLIEIKRIKDILQKTYFIAEKEQRKKTKEKRVKGNQRLS